MENASKALIIAGAILLAILLISLGIMIYNQAQDTVSDSGMDQAAITSFNNQFLKYEGTRKGTMVKSMIQEVLATNAGSSTSGTGSGGTTTNDGIKVTVQFNSETKTSTPTTSRIINNNSYDVELEYAASGRVSNIKVTGTFSGTATTGGTGG